MDDVEIHNGLNQIFCEQLRRPGLIIAPEMTQSDVEGWDSVAMVAIIMAVEERFDVEFQTDELREIRTVGDLARLVRRSKG